MAIGHWWAMAKRASDSQRGADVRANPTDDSEENSSLKTVGGGILVKHVVYQC